MNPVEKITDLVGEVGSQVDDLTESAEERQQTLSARHRADMLSDSWLSKNIRPGVLIFLMVCQLLIVVAEMHGQEVSEAVVIQVGTLLFGAYSFYFHSRRAEKVAAKNAEANIKIEELRTRAEIREEKRENRHRRKQERKLPN